MSDKDNTITKALGIEGGWVEKASDFSSVVWHSETKISDVLEKCAAWTKSEEFDLKVDELGLSVYEKKLLFMGFINGVIHQETQSKDRILEAFSKMILKGSTP